MESWMVQKERELWYLSPLSTIFQLYRGRRCFRIEVLLNADVYMDISGVLYRVIFKPS
jgi:hypothetical protein